jgi:hypothetical protein
MIRNSTHNGKDYIVVDTAIKIEKGEISIIAPVHIRVSVGKLSEKDRAIVFGKMNGVFNHLLTMKTREPIPAKKPWWKSIFS